MALLLAVFKEKEALGEGDDPGTACPGAVRRREKVDRVAVRGSVLSVPDLQEAVPRACGNGRAILCHTKTAHTIVMAS